MTITLDTYDLEPTDKVRWRRRERGTWQIGQPRGVNKDGSIDLVMDGRIRSLPPASLEVKRRGPRGGEVWEPLVTPQETE